MKRPKRRRNKALLNTVLLIIMVFLMSGGISFFTILIKLGATPDFGAYWAQGWLISFIIGIPVAFIASPVAKKIVNLIIPA